ncbi:ammonium transporter 2-like [Cicer arietinum]|uniref:Ammonium transporter 2-like n=1 Tax=Cicer arietinum TaxID=3827 RepID=A0A1S2YLR3_CICAR|nr:ammonium transporter 2-like [Cicer arietinum]
MTHLECFTHVVAGLLGHCLTSLLAEPDLCSFLWRRRQHNVLEAISGSVLHHWMEIGLHHTYSSHYTNVHTLELRMPDNQLETGNDGVHVEEAYALWGDEEVAVPHYVIGVRGVAINLRVTYK